MQAKAKFLCIFILIFALFAIPLSIAVYLYNHPTLLTSRMSNKGKLILPPITAEALNLVPNNKWSLILFEPTVCGKACSKALYFLHQMQKASGKNQDRITRILLSTVAQTSLDQNLQISNITLDQFIQVMQIKNKIDFAAQANSIFIMDPHGNIMLAYPPGTDPMDIYKDLEHLLKASQIG